MKMYLAGENGEKKIITNNLYGSDVSIGDVNILETYYYLRKNEEFTKIIPHCNSFLLDSGAFTFMKGSNKEKVDWDRYVEEYAQFIKRNQIELFFELDIDSLVGINEVERLRKKLETIAGKQPIPVWHKGRGKEYFIRMCKEYPYVALGGIAIKEIKREVFENFFPWFIKIAHDNGAKIHGLGYTSVKKLRYYHFDSVDSTAWLHGNIGGWIDVFNPITHMMEKVQKEGYSLKSKDAAIHNFIEWAKWAKYAERNY